MSYKILYPVPYVMGLFLSLSVGAMEEHFSDEEGDYNLTHTLSGEISENFEYPEGFGVTGSFHGGDMNIEECSDLSGTSGLGSANQSLRRKVKATGLTDSSVSSRLPGSTETSSMWALRNTPESKKGSPTESFSEKRKPAKQLRRDDEFVDEGPEENTALDFLKYLARQAKEGDKGSIKDMKIVIEQLEKRILEEEASIKGGDSEMTALTTLFAGSDIKSEEGKQSALRQLNDMIGMTTGWKEKINK